MRQVLKIDANGMYIEPVILQDNEVTPSDCVEVVPPTGLYKLKWNGTSWVEGMAQSDIDAIKNTPVPTNPIDDIKKQQADLTFQLMLAGVI